MPIPVLIPTFLKRCVCLLALSLAAFMPLGAQNAALVAQYAQCQTLEQRMAFLEKLDKLNMDKATFMAILAQIEAEKDHEMRFYWYFIYNQLLTYFKETYDDISPPIFKMQELAAKSGSKVEKVVADYHYALCAYSIHKINEQMLYVAYLTCYEQMRSLNFVGFRYFGLDWKLYEIGRNFYEMGDTDKALECLTYAVTFTRPEYQFYTLELNLMQAIYADQKQYYKAIDCAQKIYDINHALNPHQNRADWVTYFWQGLSALDMAGYYLELGALEKSEKLVEIGYELTNFKSDLTLTYLTMAEFEALQVVIKVKLALGKVAEAKPLLQRAAALIPHLGLGMEGNYFKPLKLYHNYIQFYEAKKDYTNAYRYTKLAQTLQDSLNRRNDKRQLWRTEMRVKVDRYQAQIESVEANSQRQAFWRNIALAFTAFVALIAFIVYRRIKKDNQTIVKQSQLLEVSLREKETLLKEIHHRVKNNLQIISGLLEKQAAQTTDLLTQKLMKEGQNRVFSMALVHQNLYQSDTLSSVQMHAYLNMLVKNIVQSQMSPCPVAVDMQVEDSLIDIDRAIPIGLIFNELITNVYKYAFQNRTQGHIHIGFGQQDARCFLEVSDNGVGLPPEFNSATTRTLGLSLVRGLVRQLDGQLDVQTGPTGTVVRCFF